MANIERIAFTVVNKETVTVWLKCLINYRIIANALLIIGESGFKEL